MQVRIIRRLIGLLFLVCGVVWGAKAQEQTALKAEIFCKTAQYLSRDAKKNHSYVGCYQANIEKNIKELPEKSRELLDKWQEKKNDQAISATQFVDEIFLLLENNRKKRLNESTYTEFKSTLHKLLSSYGHTNLNVTQQPVDSLVLLKMQVLELKIELDNTARVLRHENKKAIEELRSDLEFYVWIILALLILSFTMIFVKNRKINEKRIALLEAQIEKMTTSGVESEKTEAKKEAQENETSL